MSRILVLEHNINSLLHAEYQELVAESKTIGDLKDRIMSISSYTRSDDYIKNKLLEMLQSDIDKIELKKSEI